MGAPRPFPTGPGGKDAGGLPPARQEIAAFSSRRLAGARAPAGCRSLREQAAPWQVSLMHEHGHGDLWINMSHQSSNGVSVHVCEDARALGQAAAEATAESILSIAAVQETISIIFATGVSQLETLRALTAMTALPWDRVIGFHMDEYLGISDQHPASFRRYLREKLLDRVQLREFYGVEGDRPDAGRFCEEYAEKLRQHPPALCLLGIGENGHLAFNDPGEADFDDPADVRVVRLDGVCRQQQVNEGWFAGLAEVPQQAMTLTVPALLRVPRLIVSVPGTRKAEIVRRALSAPVSTDCPATILRTHRDAQLFLDRESAAKLPVETMTTGGWHEGNGKGTDGVR